MILQEFFFANLKVIMPSIPLSKEWEQFQIPCSSNHMISFDVSRQKILVPPKVVLQVGDSHVTPWRNGWLFLSRSNNEYRREEMTRLLQEEIPPDEYRVQEDRREEKYIGRVWISNDYKKGIIYPSVEGDECLNGMRVAMDGILPACQGIIMHASCVLERGAAVLFMGSSGMGKSTQARLWQDTFHSKIISSDAPAVYPTKQGAVAYGMPWDGSDHILCQDNGKVAAMVHLGKEKENQIRRLSTQEAFHILLQQGHLPMWDEEYMDQAILVLKRLSQRVPMYHLGCRPDKEAAVLTRNQILKEQECGNFKKIL